MSACYINFVSKNPEVRKIAFRAIKNSGQLPVDPQIFNSRLVKSSDRLSYFSEYQCHIMLF